MYGKNVIKTSIRYIKTCKKDNDIVNGLTGKEIPPSVVAHLKKQNSNAILRPSGQWKLFLHCLCMLLMALEFCFFK